MKRFFLLLLFTLSCFSFTSLASQPQRGKSLYHSGVRYFIDDGYIFKESPFNRAIHVHGSFDVQEIFIFEDLLWAVQYDGKIWTLYNGQWIVQGTNARQIFIHKSQLYALTFDRTIWVYTGNRIRQRRTLLGGVHTYRSPIQFHHIPTAHDKKILHLERNALCSNGVAYISRKRIGFKKYISERYCL